MAWIMSFQEVDRHPKTRKLARLLDESMPSVIGRLHLLWHWALDYAEDGDLSNYEPQDIADATMWEGDPQDLYSKLIAAGFINEDGTIHDWDEYAGRLIDQRKANANRQKAWRERHSNRDITVTQPIRTGATEQNRTEQNRTIHESMAAVAATKTAEPEPAEKPERRTRQKTPNDGIVDGLCAICGTPQSDSTWRNYRKVAGMLRRATPPVEPSEMPYIGQQWDRVFKGMTVSEDAIVKWLHRLRPNGNGPPGSKVAVLDKTEVRKCPKCGVPEAWCECEDE